MSIRTIARILFAAVLAISIFYSAHIGAQETTRSDSILELPGLHHKVQVITDKWGVPHVFAQDDHDVYMTMGYLQARDRFFQMDVNRRQGSGTLAELLGAGVGDQTLMRDIMFRTNGLQRAAERSLKVYSPEAMAIFQSFADGVNAWLDYNPLPSEYASLEVTRASVPRWEVLDSMVIAKLMAHWLSFDGSDLANTQRLAAYQQAGREKGFDGTKLFMEDIYRCAPFIPISTIPTRDAAIQENNRSRDIHSAERAASLVEPHTIAAIDDYLASLPDTIKADKNETGFGSNWWIVGGSNTDTGFPILAGDPHLALASPPVFYEIHLVVKDPEGKTPPMTVNGISITGIPGVLMGHNERIAWTTTSLTVDVVDYYEERVVMDKEKNTPIATLFQGKEEPLVIIPETFRANRIGDSKPDNVEPVAPGPKRTGITVPAVTRIVPRRNNGPLSPKITQSPAGTTAISVQHIGFSGTREIETFLNLARARNINDFKRALQYYDSGAQNWSYIDVDGNIGYFASGEIPLREDLEAGTVDGVPPYFVRDGTGARKNEWLKQEQRPADHSIPYQILPFDELPQLINPPQGYLVNANNDPDGNTFDNNSLNKLRRNGKSIYYLTFDYNPGYRAGTIDSLIRMELDKSRGGDGKVSVDEMKRMQSNTQLMDARFFVPHILSAFENARAANAAPPLATLAADPAIKEAVGRLGKWDFSTPTGLPEGYDAGDAERKGKPPTPEEVANSIAATIYTVWRSQVLHNIYNGTLERVNIPLPMMAGNQTMLGLRYQLENFATTQGKGTSGLNFFDAPEHNLPPSAERDLMLLKSLKDVLNLLGGESYASAFSNSKNQDDYRWGRLHRIVIHHSLRALTIPPAAGFLNVSILLPGLSVDGGYETVDLAYHSPKAVDPRDFMFSGGPAWRFVGTATKNGIKAAQVIPGGQSGNPNSQHFASQLNLWLTNGYHDSYFALDEINRNLVQKEEFRPK